MSRHINVISTLDVYSSNTMFIESVNLKYIITCKVYALYHNGCIIGMFMTNEAANTAQDKLSSGEGRFKITEYPLHGNCTYLNHI